MDNFKSWLDSKGLSSEEAAQLFGVEAQTIRNWRSGGVPERRRLHVQAVMESYGKPSATSARVLVELTIRPSLPQLQAWHNAAQAQGKDLETWTVETLDAMAAYEEKQQPQSLAAEESTGTYGPKRPAASPAPAAGHGAPASDAAAS